MNTLPLIQVDHPRIRPVDKFDALERFSAAMQSIQMYREDIASDAEFAEEEGLHRSLAAEIGSALIALNQLPAEWKALFDPEFRKAVSP